VIGRLRALPHGRRGALLIGPAVAAMIGVHLGAGGYLLAHWGWPVAATAGLIVVKMAAVLIYRHRTLDAPRPGRAVTTVESADTRVDRPDTGEVSSQQR
jgi:hypothetical protein